VFLNIIAIIFASTLEENDNENEIPVYHGLNHLISSFSEIIENPEEYIGLNLFQEDALTRQASGIYKKIPYYQKLYPIDSHQDRYFIQQNPFTGEFQLIENFNYIHRRSIRALFDPENPTLSQDDVKVIHTFQVYHNMINDLSKTKEDYEKTINDLLKTTEDQGKTISGLLKTNEDNETKINGLLKTNEKLEYRHEQIIQEIKKTKEKYQTHKTELQRKEQLFYKQVKERENNLEEKIKFEEERIQEKEFKIEQKLEKIKSEQKENEQKLFNFDKILETKQSLIDSQNENIKHLEKVKYQNEAIVQDNLNLQHKVKRLEENIKILKKENKEKEIAYDKILRMQNKKVEACENNMKKAFSENSAKYEELSQNVQNAEKELEFGTRLITLLERDYVDYVKSFEKYFVDIPNVEHQKIFYQILCHPGTMKDKNCRYENALIAYGAFLYLTRFRKLGIIVIPDEIVLDPQKVQFSSLNPNLSEIEEEQEDADHTILCAKDGEQDEYPFLMK